MSARLDLISPDSPPRILMVVANAGVSPVTGWPVGFWWSELTHPYWVFIENGYRVDLASPDGGDLAADSWSDPRDESGYSADDILSLGFISSSSHNAMTENTQSIDDIELGDYDAVFFVGGQSPMVTYPGSDKVETFLRRAWEAGIVVTLVCHATCLLLTTKLSDGQLLVAGKTWTGFADSEEQFADDYVGQKIQPFWIEEEARKIPGTNYIVNGAFKPHAVRDGRLITGQQQYSGSEAARLVVEALGR